MIGVFVYYFFFLLSLSLSVSVTDVCCIEINRKIDNDRSVAFTYAFTKKRDEMHDDASEDKINYNLASKNFYFRLEFFFSFFRYVFLPFILRLI